MNNNNHTVDSPLQKNANNPIKITLIGAGGVATNLGRLFKERGAGNRIKIIQLLGRSELSTSQLAAQLDCPFTTDPAALNQSSDLYVIAIQDREIAEILPKLSIPQEAMIVHTAGGVPIDIFKGLFKHYGVLYPLQSLRKETSIIPAIPFYLDANSPASKTRLESFALKAALDYQWADDNGRMQLHIAAVFCSNFPNYFYALAEDFCNRQGLDFTRVLPVIEETGNRLAREGLSPASLQTGPAIRKDKATTDKHAALLASDPEALHIYTYMTKLIMDSPLLNK